MKKMLILGLLVSCFQLVAMEETGKAKLLTFVKAQKGEDLTAYQEILLDVYPEYANNREIKAYLQEALKRQFAILAGWAGQKGKCFIKAHDGQTPVGFLTLEALNEDETEIAFHQSPLLTDYLDKAPQYLDQVKNEFPRAKVIFTSCSDKVTRMQKFIKSLGFHEDPNYLPSKEIVPNPMGFQGYKKSLE